MRLVPRVDAAGRKVALARRVSTALPTAFNSHFFPRRRQRRHAVWLTQCVRWSMGSLLFLASWAVLLGPIAYAKHLLSTPRLPFTAVYFGSIALTLYFAIGVSLNDITLALPFLPWGECELRFPHPPPCTGPPPARGTC